MKGSRMLRRTLVLGALCVVVAAVGSVAWAMTSATNDKLVACARKSSGALRLVTAAKDCRKTERLVTWNQQGPRGLPGARGVAGEDGLDGLDGDDGDDGLDGLDGDDGDDGDDGAASEPKWKYVLTDVSVATGITTVSAGTCAAPTPQAVNGGYRPATPTTAVVRVTASGPVGAGPTASQWNVQFENTSGSAQPGGQVWVLCATGTAG